MRSKNILRTVLPWLVTLVALWWVLHNVEWDKLVDHIKAASPAYIAAAVALTVLSYVLRSLRWQTLFPTPCLRFIDSFKVLILGFFMNNTLPLRTGEFVRAHLGSKATQQSRSLVLGTIASERLVDGIAISLFFLVCSVELQGIRYARELTLVSMMFFAAGVVILLILANKQKIVALVQDFHAKKQIKPLRYVTSKAGNFIDGLDPLYSLPRFVKIMVWSLVIWSVELTVFYFVSLAYSAQFDIAQYPLFALCALFMVAVNFSSLIPAAPGGIGVIEAVATSILTSAGLDHEQALAMVLTQHIIQYVVVGIPGALALATWKGRVVVDEGEADGEG